MTARKTLLILAIIFLIALGLRLWGIGFGMPYELHVDEDNYVRQAATMGGRGLEPVMWNNPPLFNYILLAEYIGLFGVGKLLGWYSSVGQFAETLRLDPTLLYLIGRGTSALLGALTVLVTYWIGAQAYNRKAGAVSAALLAVCYLAVRESHFAVNDAAATLFISLALLAAVKILKTGEWRWYLLAGAAVGLGFATKYWAAAGIFPVIVAAILSAREAPDVKLTPKLAGAFGITLVTAIVGSPYYVLSINKVLNEVYLLYLEGKHGFEGWQLDPAGGFVFYLQALWWGMGGLLFLLCLAGLLIALLRHDPMDLVMVSYPLFMYVFMGGQKMYFARFALPLIPPLIVLGASFIEKMAMSIFTVPKMRLTAVAAIVLLAGAQPLISSLRFDALLVRADTRVIAKEWIEQNLPNGSKVAQDWFFHGVPLLSFANTEKAKEMAKFDVLVVNGRGLPDHPLEWYRANGYEYLITTSTIADLELVDPAANAERKAFYRSLDEELALIKTFSPYREGANPPYYFDEMYGPAMQLWERERPGPVLKVYAMRQH